MIETIRRARWVVPVAGVALVVGGCGGSSSSTSSTSAQSANSNQLVKYAQCMRSHGLPDFPDPVNGRLELKATQGGDLDPSSPAFQAAQRACKSLAPAGLGSAPSPQRQAQLLRVARCMRAHGVPAFPDPSFSGGVFALKLPRGIDTRSPQFQAAIQACRSIAFGGGAP